MSDQKPSESEGTKLPDPKITPEHPNVHMPVTGQPAPKK